MSEVREVDGECGVSGQRITAAEVAVMEIGGRVWLCREEDDGSVRKALCTVAGLPGRKFLTRREQGELRCFRLKEYPGRFYERVRTEERAKRKGT